MLNLEKIGKTTVGGLLGSGVRADQDGVQQAGDWNYLLFDMFIPGINIIHLKLNIIFHTNTSVS